MLLILLVWDVHRRPWISEFLCETKVNHVDHRGRFVDAHDEICGFNVSMDQITRVDEFYTLQLGAREVSSTEKGSASGVTPGERKCSPIGLR